MKQLISARRAAQILLGILGVVVVVHILVLIGVVSSDVVWGGNATEGSVVVLEGIALATTLLFMAVVAAKGGMITLPVPSQTVDIGMWVMVVYFSLNTLGNLLAQSNTETLFFAPLTLVMVVLALRLAVE